MGVQLTLAATQLAAAAGKAVGEAVKAGSRRPVADLASGKSKAEIARKMPAQKPGRSIQTYSTPMDLIDAIKVKWRLKQFAWDLAADGGNTKAARYFTEDQDSLAQNWRALKGNLWLNPPFARIGPWAKKCALSTPYRIALDEGEFARRIFFLVPAAPGSNWWRDFVHEKARVVFLNGRPCFDGKAGFPKDISLCIYGEKPGYEVWSWQTKRSRTPVGKNSSK